MFKVINLLGGPGAGKSTMALRLTGELKHRRMNAEYVSEWAKDLVWHERYKCLADQLWVFGQQHHAIYMLAHKVDYVITDSPILLSLHYVEGSMTNAPTAPGYEWYEHFKELVLETYDLYDNVNYVIQRGDRKFIQAGRNQNEEDAMVIDNNINNLLDHYGFFYKTVSSLDDILLDLGLPINV